MKITKQLNTAVIQPVPAGLDSLKLEVTLRELYENALEGQLRGHTGEQKAFIDLHLLNEEEEGYEQEPFQYGAILDYLKSCGLLKEYKISKEKQEYTISVKNFDTKPYTQETLVMKSEFAECVYFPSKVIEFALKDYEPKRQYFEQLADLYGAMIRILKTYFSGELVLDIKVNRYYQLLVSKVEDLISQKVRSKIEENIIILLHDLLLEQEQLLHIQQNLNAYLEPMYNGYAYLLHFASLYSPHKVNKKDEELVSLEKYFSEFQKQKENPNYSPAASIPQFASEVISAANIYEIKFDDNTASLEISGKVCQLPPFLNEHFLCRAMFQFMPNEPVDWSLVYEKMFGSSVKDKVKNKRTVYDAVLAINKRFRQFFKTEDELLTWEGKTIKRKF